MASARPDSAASHLLRKSRIWLPAALPCSLGSPCAAYASMNSYASSMALQREASASRASSPGDGDDAFGDDEVMCWSGSAGRLVRRDTPAIGFVMLQVLTARDHAEDHRLRDPPLFRADREVDVRDDEADQSDAGDTVQDIGEAPGGIAEEIRIAGEDRRPDARHH